MRDFIFCIIVGMLISLSSCAPRTPLVEPVFLTELNNRASIKKGQIIQVKNLSFQKDSTALSNTSYEALHSVYDFLRQNPNIIIEIGGHTNNIPSHEYCDKVSTIRAENVAKYLVQKGITRNRISAKGYGKTQPIVSNKTAKGKRKNQRIDIKIISTGR